MHRRLQRACSKSCSRRKGSAKSRSSRAACPCGATPLRKSNRNRRPLPPPRPEARLRHQHGQRRRRLWGCARRATTWWVVTGMWTVLSRRRGLRGRTSESGGRACSSAAADTARGRFGDKGHPANGTGTATAAPPGDFPPQNPCVSLSRNGRSGVNTGLGAPNDESPLLGVCGVEGASGHNPGLRAAFPRPAPRAFQSPGWAVAAVCARAHRCPLTHSPDPQAHTHTHTHLRS